MKKQIIGLLLKKDVSQLCINDNNMLNKVGDTGLQWVVRNKW